MTVISFEKANKNHLATIHQWLKESHVIEFWDNSEAHKADIQHFIDGRQTNSSYFDGAFTYWVGSINKTPACLILTSYITDWVKNKLSTTGKTITLDFMIGNTSFLGKGLASYAINEFTSFFQTNVDTSVDTYFVDPATTNNRAIHVYKKAGFRIRGEYTIEHGYFKGSKNLIMTKKILCHL